MRGKQAQIGRYLITRFQQHDIAGNKMLAINTDTLTATNYMGTWREHMADRIHCLFRLALLNEADNGVGNNHGQDDTRIGPVTQCRGNQRRAEQHIDENVVEMQQETNQRAAFCRFR